jgi:hypothetical protein
VPVGFIRIGIKAERLPWDSAVQEYPAYERAGPESSHPKKGYGFIIIGVLKNFIIPHQDQDPGLGSSHKKKCEAQNLQTSEKHPFVPVDFIRIGIKAERLPWDSAVQEYPAYEHADSESSHRNEKYRFIIGVIRNLTNP